MSSGSNASRNSGAELAAAVSASSSKQQSLKRQPKKRECRVRLSISEAPNAQVNDSAAAVAGTSS
jgi:hypothetical protein